MLRWWTELTQPREKLVSLGQGWVEDFDDRRVKSIGVLEILTAIGLILPAALDIAPTLTAVAAVGAVLLMVGAAPPTSAGASSTGCR